jgi:hypothetical protein
MEGISRSWGSTTSSVDCSAWHRMLIGVPFFGRRDLLIQRILREIASS